MNDDEANRNRRDTSGEPSAPDNGMHPAVDTLSEYLDRPSGLTPAERETIDRHLASCEECQAVLADLRLMVRAFGSLPDMEAPRSFALTAEMLEPATPPVVLRESAQWQARHAAKVRWATAVAAALFVIVISADLVTNGLRGGVSRDDAAGDSAAQTEQLRFSEEPAAGAAEEAATADVTGDEFGQRDEAESGSAATPATEPEADSGSDATAQEDSDMSTFSQPSDDAEAAGETPQTESALSAETANASDEPDSDAAVRGDADELNWRIAEVSLALILALLLAVMIGLPKQRGRRP